MVQPASDASPLLPLNDDSAMPQLGLGVLQIPLEATAEVVSDALGAGYRLIDTAAAYRNEAGVGEGLRASGVPREDIFLTTKLSNEHQGYDEALRAFDESAERLGVDYVDLYLIHWPAPQRGRYLDSWRALVRLREEGRARSIGVSNFMIEHLRRVIAETGVAPSVNQVELHPGFQQSDLHAFHVGQGIVTQSWSPLGRGGLVKHPELARIGARHGKTAAQAIIRWHLQSGLGVIPKTVRPERMQENREVFDFALDEADMTAIARLDDPAGRIGFDPLDYN